MRRGAMEDDPDRIPRQSEAPSAGFTIRRRKRFFLRIVSGGFVVSSLVLTLLPLVLAPGRGLPHRSPPARLPPPPPGVSVCFFFILARGFSAGGGHRGGWGHPRRLGEGHVPVR